MFCNETKNKNNKFFKRRCPGLQSDNYDNPTLVPAYVLSIFKTLYFYIINIYIFFGHGVRMCKREACVHF